MNKKLDIRPSPIAGQWYPSDARRLASQVDQYMDAAGSQQIEGEVVGVMAPHAGHLYSGPVAGYAFAALRGMEADVVVVVSPMHYPYYDALLTTSHDAYATPLGTIPVATDLLKMLDERLRAKLGYGLASVSHDSEHSLEIELPFLQQALAKPFDLLPIMVREQNEHVARSLGEALADVLLDHELMAGRSAILVASTDLSHFYSQEVAKQLDKAVLQQVQAFDPQGVVRIEEQGKGFACGRGALAAVLWAAKALGANQTKILKHATSGDVTGDYDRVVGYGAAVFTRYGANATGLQ
jgi:AmmeMemoRadiSam system protein B